MSKSKLDERHEQEYARYEKIGRENIEYVNKATKWCKKLKLKMVSGGLYAEMTGLPIGGHRLECDYATDAVESMNVKWITTDFIAKCCYDCKFHESNGNDAWGQAIIEEAQQKARTLQEQEQRRQAYAKQVADRLHELGRKGNAAVDDQEREILTILGNAFTGQGISTESAEILRRAAQIGADVFPRVVLEIILQEASSEEYGQAFLPTCLELALQRLDLRPQILQLALGLVLKGRHLQTASEILNIETDETKKLLRDDHIRALISFQSYAEFLDSIVYDESKYSAVTKILITSFDEKADQILKILTELLSSDDRARANCACVILNLQKKIPNLSVQLLKPLTLSLDLPIDGFNSSADSLVIDVLAKGLEFDFEQVQTYLEGQIRAKRPAVQELIVKAYTKAIDSYSRFFYEEKPQKIELRDSQSKAIRTCLRLAKDETLDMLARIKAIEGYESACKAWPELFKAEFGSLIGYYSLICEKQTKEHIKPKIVLPFQDHVSKMEAALEVQLNDSQRHAFKRSVEDCLIEIVKHDPRPVIDDLIQIYQSSKGKQSDPLRFFLINLLGHAGHNAALRSLVLPEIWSALMDFTSQVSRRSAIDALIKIFGRSKAHLPENIIQALIVLLNDEYVIVHRSAIKAIREFARDFPEKHAIEAYQIILNWFATYAKEERMTQNPYNIDEIYPPLIRFAVIFPKLFRRPTLLYLCAVFPVKEYFVAKKLLEALVSFVRPKDTDAQLVVKLVLWYLVEFPRDRYNSYRNSERRSLFAWIAQVPPETILNLEKEFVESATKLAKSDPYESVRFAAFFSANQRHDLEALTLNTAFDAIPDTKREEPLKNLLQRLYNFAEANSLKTRKPADA
jgi:hypothetical protein